MYRFAVCDDNPADTDYVISLIKEWNQKAGVPLQTEKYSSAEAFLFAYEEDNSVDVLFLDIEMGAMSGVELAKKLRAMDARLQIVFITGYMEYIDQGYDVEALHYLIKPVTGEKLGAVLDRAMARLKTRESALTLSVAGSRVRLPLHEIQSLEVMKNNVTVHAEDGQEYSVRSTLNELERELDDGFYRIHRSIIVNLRFVKKVTKTAVTLKSGRELPLARNSYEGLNQAMIRYF